MVTNASQGLIIWKAEKSCLYIEMLHMSNVQLTWKGRGSLRLHSKKKWQQMKWQEEEKMKKICTANEGMPGERGVREFWSCFDHRWLMWQGNGHLQIRAWESCCISTSFGESCHLGNLVAWKKKGTFLCSSLDVNAHPLLHPNMCSGSSTEPVVHCNVDERVC